MRAIILALLILPTALVGFGWFRLAKRPVLDGRSRVLRLVVLALATGSQMLLMLGLVVPDVIGPDYDVRRYATILVNVGTMMAMTIVAAVIRRQAGGVLIATCASISGSWLYMAAVSSVV